MTARRRITTAITVLLALGLTAASAAQIYGMKQYVDKKYGFSFWYPASLKVTVTAGNDDKSFPGGVLVETLIVEATSAGLRIGQPLVSTTTTLETDGGQSLLTFAFRSASGS